ncbi:MAG TPA: hypothetical protein VLF67_00195 [Candidatus Saccharimonas sp.]|nr:hypothetical protein [Candidatus Saccharimonas sp.]
MPYQLVVWKGFHRRRVERSFGRVIPEVLCCRRHPGIDLTPLVIAELSQEPGSIRGANLVRSARPRLAEGQPFVVAVKCTGNGRPHEVALDGYWWEHERVVT